MYHPKNSLQNNSPKHHQKIFLKIDQKSSYLKIKLKMDPNIDTKNYLNIDTKIATKKDPKIDPKIYPKIDPKLAVKYYNFGLLNLMIFYFKFEMCTYFAALNA